MRTRIRWILPLLVVAGLAAVAASAATSHASPPAGGQTATPIKHVVVIFQENVSFDHYFGTYPFATNNDGNNFTPAQGTPVAKGFNFSLLAANPNTSNPQRLDSSVAGQLTCDQDHDYSDEQQAFDGGKMDHFVQSVGTGGGNSPEGAPCQASQVMDYYDGNVVTGLWNYAQHYAMSDNSFETTFGPSAPGAINLVSGDTGGIDTAHEANSPSIATSTSPNADITPDGHGGYSLTSDPQPYWDDCSTRDAVALTGKNIGDLLNARHISWGWFQGGFRPSTSYADALTAIGQSGQSTSTFIPNEFKTYFSDPSHRPANSSNQALCSSVTPIGVGLGGTGQWGYKDNYIPHHEPFEYYASTANPHHLAPAGLAAIGTDTQSYVNGQPQFDTANHQYDTSDFDALVGAITAGNMSPDALPAVSFIKAPGYQDGHAGYSDPADEQQFVVHTINELEQSPDWSSTAVIINYDDSDGWYDHAFSGVINQSRSVADNLSRTQLGTIPPNTTSGLCTAPYRGAQRQGRAHPLGGENGRCGFGPRLPMLVISPWSKSNYIDHNLSDQSSIINFVEYNWGLPGIGDSFDRILGSLDHHEGIKFDLGGMFDFGSPPDTTPYILDPATGEPSP
jgi:phospholipase C